MRAEDKTRLARLLAVAVALFAIGIAYYSAVKKLGGGIPCPIYTITGKFCPGCGITRMFVSLFSGDILSAVSYNALVMLLLPLGVFFTVRWSAEYVKHGKLGKLKLAEKIIIIAVIALIIVFAVLRNTEAFAYLAPVR
jgi:hypothetical protein